MIKERDTYFDFLRGIAIVFVIGIHTYSDNATHINLFLRQFLNCAVPIFLAISGYFIGSKHLDTRKTYFSFLKKQIPRVYIPMLVWSIPWLLLHLYTGGNLYAGIFLVLVGGMSIFYFIPLIIQYYLLTPFIQKVNKCYGGGYAVLITIVGICTFDCITKVMGYSLSLILSAAPFPVWMIFYVMGVLVAQGIRLPAQNRFPLVWALVGIVFSCLQIAWIYSYNGVVAPGIKFSSHMYTYFLLMWLFSSAAKQFYAKIQQCKLVSHLVILGKLSFFVYLTHYLFIFVINVLALPNWWMFRWLFIAFFSYLFALCISRFLPNGLKLLFGF